MKINRFRWLGTGIVAVVVLTLASCSDKDPEEVPVFEHGVFVVNEGNTDKNNASISHYNDENNAVTQDAYGVLNRNAVLGDLARDIKQFGSKIYITLNGSNKVEILDSKTFRKITSVSITSPRWLASANGKVFVSSYDDNVYVLDGNSNRVVKKIPVGRDPEQMAVSGNKLYVANSGGLDFNTALGYDNTVSVIDVGSLTESKKITISMNPNQVLADQYGDIYVTTNGNYNDVPSNIYLINTSTDQAHALDIRVNNMALDKDIAYIYQAEYSFVTNSYEISYSTLNVKDETRGPGFIKDGSETSIEFPYGLGVDPVSGDIYVADAKDFQAHGAVHRFSKDGKKKNSFTVGTNPSAFYFINK